MLAWADQQKKVRYQTLLYAIDQSMKTNSVLDNAAIVVDQVKDLISTAEDEINAIDDFKGKVEELDDRSEEPISLE